MIPITILLFVALAASIAERKVFRPSYEARQARDRDQMNRFDALRDTSVDELSHDVKPFTH